MYDKLGDLLNETLESGEVKFVKINKTDFSNHESKADNKESSYNSDSEVNKTTFASEFNTSQNPKEQIKYIYKKITPEIERACRLLDLNINDKEMDLKKAYKEKIKYYHPDRYVDNPVLYKVATDKTREVVEAYNLLTDFLSY